MCQISQVSVWGIWHILFSSSSSSLLSSTSLTSLLSLHFSHFTSLSLTLFYISPFSHSSPSTSPSSSPAASGVIVFISIPLESTFQWILIANDHRPLDIIHFLGRILWIRFRSAFLISFLFFFTFFLSCFLFVFVIPSHLSFQYFNSIHSLDGIPPFLPFLLPIPSDQTFFWQLTRPLSYVTNIQLLGPPWDSTTGLLYSVQMSRVRSMASWLSTACCMPFVFLGFPWFFSTTLVTSPHGVLPSPHLLKNIIADLFPLGLL